MGSKLLSTRNLYTDVYGSLFIHDKTQKQPRCPSADEWINCGHPENGMLFGAKKKGAIEQYIDTKET